MTIEEAKRYVADQIAIIEARNKGKELRPWERDACADAPLHWSFVQKRLAWNHPRPEQAVCCEDLHLTTERSEAQIGASKTAGANWLPDGWPSRGMLGLVSKQATGAQTGYSEAIS
jgi:hypothetical protein